MFFVRYNEMYPCKINRCKRINVIVNKGMFSMLILSNDQLFHIFLELFGDFHSQFCFQTVSTLAGYKTAHLWTHVYKQSRRC